MAEVPTLVFPRPSHTSTLNDNYCVVSKTLPVDLIRRDPVCYKTHLSDRKTLKFDVSYPVVFHAPSVHSHGPPQKKGVRPAPCQNKIKHLKGACCVNPCLSAPSVPNVPNAVSKQNVGGRLQSFWQVWQNVGSNPRVVSILKEGYTLPFKQRPLLTRFPLVQNGYSSPTKNMYLKDDLISLLNKLAVEKVVVRLSLAFYNRLFLVPKQKMEANLRSESSQFIPQHRHFQNGDSRDNPVVLGNRGVDHIAGLQRRILPHSHCPKVKKVSQVLPVQSNLSVHSSSLWVGHSSPRVHQGGQGSETHDSSTGYQNPPVPRRLVTESSFPGDLPTTYPDPLGPVSTVGLDSKYDKIGISPQTGLQFCRLPVRPDHWSSSTHSRPVGSTSGETKVHKGTSQPYSQAINVPDRPFNCHGEAGVFRSSSYEAHSVASEETLARSGGVR